MCSLHPRLVKKLKDEFEGVAVRVAHEVTDSDVIYTKTLKRKGVDELTTMKNCPSAERYLKVLNLPTPVPQNIVMFQNHIESILKELRR